MWDEVWKAGATHSAAQRILLCNGNDQLVHVYALIQTSNPSDYPRPHRSHPFTPVHTCRPRTATMATS